MHLKLALKMPTKLYRWLIILVTVSALNSSLWANVRANDLGNNVFSMSPVDYTNNQTAGDSFNVEFTVFNNGSDKTTINLYNAEINFKNNQPSLTVNDLITKNWVNFGQNFYIIPANSSLDITAKVTIPADTKAGAYYPAVLVTRVSDTSAVDTDLTQTIINSALAFRINLNVLPAGQILSSSAKASGLEVTNPVVINSVDINYGITNGTDYYVKPIAYLQILNRDGEIIWRSVVNDNNSLIYPGQVLAASTNLQLPAFKLTDVGQYTAEFLVVDNQFGTTDIIKTKFTVIPLPLILVVAGIIVLLLFIIVWNSRQHHRR